MIVKTVLTMAVLAALSGCAGSGGSGASSNQIRENPAPPPGAIALSVTERGFVPAEVTVGKGGPVTLVVTRKTENTCATEFVIKSHGVRQPLPLNQPVAITFTPTESGELRYACGMDMIAGRIVVR